MHFLVTVAVLVSAPPSGGAAARQAEATAALVAAERAAGAEVVEDPLALIARGWTAESNLAFFARGARLVDEGRRALAHVELERAEALFAEAERLYPPESMRPGVAQQWAEAAKWHGVALFELRRRSDAARAWSMAKRLESDSPLTDALVRPEVARAFAAAPIGDPIPPRPPDGGDDQPSANVESAVARIQRTLGVDEVIVAAIALDAGTLTYAATRRPAGCGTETLTSTRADELVKRLAAATCLAEERIAVLEAPVIAHPRPAPSLAVSGSATPRERSARLWRKPWLWVGVVGALGVGVVLAVNLWPREATYSATLDFHQFAITSPGAR